MNLLLDTHTILWFFWDDPQLSDPAKDVITDPANRKLVSAVSYWEIAIKVSFKKLDLGEPFRSFMTREIARNCFEILPISLNHAAVVSDMAFHHRDPFDRLLIAQAIWENIPIVSAYTAFDAYPITRIW
ncbi:MAG: type II toxin-antitoxin system VapC family toxin [Acidobacteriota bacterium]